MVSPDLLSANKLAEDYPVDPAAGNDDTTTGDEDNDPYSNNELQPGTQNNTPKGKLASEDPPMCPVFIDAAGAANDTVEYRAHFGEFVRLQIGNSAQAGYRNWYPISDYQLWRHVGKLQKDAAGTWVDNGSTAETNNADW